MSERISGDEQQENQQTQNKAEEEEEEEEEEEPRLIKRLKVDKQQTTTITKGKVLFSLRYEKPGVSSAIHMVCSPLSSHLGVVDDDGISLDEDDDDDEEDESILDGVPARDVIEMHLMMVSKDFELHVD